MRLVWKSNNKEQFLQFCSFLKNQKIDFTAEEALNTDWGSDEYGNGLLNLWVHNEDELLKVEESLKKFLEDPKALNEPITPPPQKKEVSEGEDSYSSHFLEDTIDSNEKNPLKASSSKLQISIKATTFLVALCCLIFLFEWWQEKNYEQVPMVVKQELIGVTGVRKTLLFDYPTSAQVLDKIITIWGIDSLAKPQDLPPSGKFLYDQFISEPSWKGFYPVLVTMSEKELLGKNVQVPNFESEKTFEKIREGEVWRLVSPISLHYDILHLFFNMVWLLLLGTQIEERIGTFRYFIFIIVVAIISNVSQYLMCGPYFMGFSGVICGMATFIRMRQKIAPWEGYQMSSGTYTFIMFFISALAVFSLISFFLEVFQSISLPIAIANTAHLAGAISGYFIGRFNYFSWQFQGEP